MALAVTRERRTRRAAAAGSSAPAAAALSLALAWAPTSFASSDQVFSNATPIVWGTFPTSTPTVATPYPSLINVSGIGGNTITRAKVILRNFQHGYPDDVDLLLEAPDGTRSIVMSDAGGTAAVNGEFPTFSPAAALPVPGNSWIDDAVPQRATNAIDDISGSVADEFPAPGPGTVVAAAADLDAFNGVNPNGNWKLYAVDDYPMLDGGALLEGWSLVLTVPSVFTVTKTADSDDHTCDSDCSLREAIEAAGAGDLIRFSPLFDRAQTITLNGTSLVVSRDMTIAGPGAARLTVSAAGLSRVILTGNNVALSLSGMTITGGRVAENGGGIKSQGPLSLRNVAVAGNRVEGSTGGGLDQIVGMANIVGCTFSDNHAGTSGAIDFELAGGSATLRIANSTFSGNTADGEVGAIDVFNPAAGLASVEIVDSTIVGNRAAVEGGILLYTQGTPDAKIDLTLRNTIIANNLPTNLDKGGAAGGPITVTSRGYNLTNDAASDDLVDATDLLGVDPRLGPLNNNGGQTETRALLGGSPALDAGERSGYAADARGAARGFDTPNSDPAAGGDSSDIGAVEMHSLIVTNTASSGLGSLRDAITTANIDATQDDILFDYPFFGVVPQVINLAGVLPDIAQSLSVNGPGAKLLTVRRDTGGDYGIFSCVNGTSELALSGLTIGNGRADAGGGIYSSSRLSLAEAAVSGNVGVGEIGAGGVALVFADGTIKGSTISGNATAGSGGGIYFQGLGDQRLRVVDSTLSGNQALFGGGVSVLVQDPGTGVLELTNSTVAGNTGGNGGVDVFAQVTPAAIAVARVRNTIVANNTLPNLGAGTANNAIADIVSLGYNLTNDATAAYLDRASDKFNTNPLLGPLADNGGPTRTHALLPGSPAIDAGDWSGGEFDQRGFLRPNDQLDVANAAGTAGFDIGAVEDDTLFRNGFE